MSARALVSGVLFRATPKISKLGKPYVAATIRDGRGDETRWWSTLIFEAVAVDEISRLGIGDPIAVAGEIDAQVYAPDGGEPRINLQILVDRVVSVRKPAKPKEQRVERELDPV